MGTTKLPTNARIDILQNSFSTAWLNILSSDAAPVAEAISNKISSASKTMTLPLSLPQKGFRKIQGAIESNPIDVEPVIVTADTYVDQFEISEDDFNDQKDNALIDLYQPQFNELANRAKIFEDELLIQYLEGSNTKSFDGEALFSDSHTWGGRTTVTQDNNLGLSLSADNLKTAIASLRKFKDHLGQVIGLRGQRLTLVVPPDLEFTALQLANAAFYPSTISGTSGVGSNVFQGAFDVVVGDRLNGNYWYLVAGRPVNFVERLSPQIKLIWNELERKFVVRGTIREGVGIGSWNQIIRSTV